MDKNGQNRGGARVQIAGYKKMRIEAFHMLEQLIEANNHLSDVVRDKHNLLKKASSKVVDMRDRITELENTCSEYEATGIILRDKIELQRQDIINQEHDKAFDPDCKIEKGDVN
jgi:hypothetical protein